MKNPETVEGGRRDLETGRLGDGETRGQGDRGRRSGSGNLEFTGILGFYPF